MLVDGHGHAQRGYESAAPLEDHVRIAPDYDLAWGQVNGFGWDREVPDAAHERTLVCVRGAHWLVVDTLTLDTEREVSALWHFHPVCTVAEEGAGIVTTDTEAGNLRIVATAEDGWDIALMRGEETPAVQGWYSAVYAEKEPATCAVFTRRLSAGTHEFASLLLPARGALPSVTIARTGDRAQPRLTVTLGAQEQRWRIDTAARALQAD